MPERTPVGAKRSGALGGFAESCASGLSWHNRPAEGETKLDFSAGMERSGMQDEALLNQGARERAQPRTYLREVLVIISMIEGW